MTLKLLYKENRNFSIGFFLFAIASIFLLVFYSKADGFYLLNLYHSVWLDEFFIYFTYLGDGYFCFGVGLLLFIFKRRHAGFMAMISYSISGIIAQVFKNYVVEARPALYLKYSPYKHFIDQVTLHNFSSFPSGHATSAFALAAILSFDAKNKNWSILFLLLAIMVGFSRIYLAQHFMDDVLAGSVIGIISSVICWIYLDKFCTKWFPLRTNIN
jgi:membrane-associated phospholipid phosphatase